MDAFLADTAFVSGAGNSFWTQCVRLLLLPFSDASADFSSSLRCSASLNKPLVYLNEHVFFSPSTQRRDGLSLRILHIWSELCSVQWQYECTFPCWAISL